MPAPAVPAPAAPAPAVADAGGEGKSVISQQLESLWQDSAPGNATHRVNAAAGASDGVASDVGFVRDEHAFADMAAAAAPQVMRLSMQQLDEVSSRLCWHLRWRGVCGCFILLMRVTGAGHVPAAVHSEGGLPVRQQ